MSIKRAIAAVFCSLVVGISGCGGHSLPQVNDENCTPEKINKIEDAQQRTEFASACLRR